MKVLSTQEMREADRRCIEELGMPGCVLMNNAGTAAFKYVKDGPVVVVCGKGNNGGDGFVIARLALLAGLPTRVLLLAHPEDLRGDAAVFMEVYRNLGGAIESLTEPDAVASALQSLERKGTIVDAMLGTGAKGGAQGLVLAAIQHWPEMYTLAVDVPSGLDADSGIPGAICIRADLTVTFAFAKQGFLNPAAKNYLGSLVVEDIGLPDCCAVPAVLERLCIEEH